MLRILTFAAIALLILLRLARTRFGARLLGIPQRVLEIVFLVALLLAGVLAVLFEQWILLAVVVVLLVLSLIEELRRRKDRSARAGTGRSSQHPRSR
ncbi:MAG: hypothetical protein ACTHWF_12545 [Brachybacterium sp.]|uniref:hypothetical protein n=1 Tax=Brachybacterium sp. Z12 TaxID=2759167 RepID=UPI0018616A9F|nr:hypothetical protein [Brachybacterium sp. Z12]QNN81772.1 hypothetical protein H3H54_10170 [Brachybacterium sp. Z12]